MKRVAASVLLVLMLWGCSFDNGAMDRVIAARSALQSAGGCRFQATVTADYGEQVHTFVLRCEGSRDGTVTFEVISPESIARITGSITEEAGNLTFDDQVLAFDLLADGQLSPVSGPWIVLNTLRSGYITSCGTDGSLLLAVIDDSYEDDAFSVDIWLDTENLPVAAEILWQGRRILSVKIENFEYL